MGRRGSDDEIELVNDCDEGGKVRKFADRKPNARLYGQLVTRRMQRVALQEFVSSGQEIVE